MHTKKLPFLLNDFTCNKSKKQLPIYCVKFCPFTSEYIFAAAILNKVEIYKIDDGERMTKVRTFEAKNNEYFYALDWTIDKNDDEMLLIGAGLKGEIHNFLKTSIFGVNLREKPNAINEIVFSPKNEHLFAAAYEDGSVCLYNLKSETCLAICQTQRPHGLRQCISVSFDPSGNYLAYGGMTNEIFLVNLKDSKELQIKLKQSLKIDVQIDPARLNLMNNMCMVKNLHVNFIDCINWYAESSFITKSANGDIMFWDIKGLDKQKVQFRNANCLKLIEQNFTIIDNCNLWFIRFTLDPLLTCLTIGTCNGELVLWNLLNESFYSEYKSFISNEKLPQATIRQTTFSNNGKYLVCCTDDGSLVSFIKSRACDERLVKTGCNVNKKTRKSKKISY